jgi:hypothetical protein
VSETVSERELEADSEAEQLAEPVVDDEPDVESEVVQDGELDGDEGENEWERVVDDVGEFDGDAVIVNVVDVVLEPDVELVALNDFEADAVVVCVQG